MPRTYRLSRKSKRRSCSRKRSYSRRSRSNSRKYKSRKYRSGSRKSRTRRANTRTKSRTKYGSRTKARTWSPYNTRLSINSLRNYIPTTPTAPDDISSNQSVNSFRNYIPTTPTAPDDISSNQYKTYYKSINDLPCGRLSSKTCKSSKNQFGQRRCYLDQGKYCAPIDKYVVSCDQFIGDSEACRMSGECIYSDTTNSCSRRPIPPKLAPPPGYIPPKNVWSDQEDTDDYNSEDE
jgi:hypothetical protein